MPITTSIGLPFSEISDPRMISKVHHKLSDIIALTVCAVICGAENWVEIESYGKCKEEWLKNYGSLGIRGVVKLMYSDNMSE